ncbi:MAG TPA: DUF4268 domain-containing protein [Bacilli bacterium]|nr:DUF4268 domain-containing protein [Bacilli bacterium]
MNIGQLENVSLRSIWKHEEHDFSVWLAQHIEVLSDTLKLSLTEIQREKRVGSFQVDLVAEDADGQLVIIENQLEPTDHDHLGKVLTYLTNLEAKTAVWIVSHPRPEHMRAFQWLNESTPADISFYLVQLAAYKIGNSLPAPLFTVIVAPSADAKEIGREKKDLAERHVIRLRFWEQLLNRARDRGLTLHAGRSATKDSWLGAGAGISGVSFNYVAWLKERTAVELNLDTGNRERNKKYFDQLYRARERIVSATSIHLEWERLDEKDSSRIRSTIELGGLNEEEKWSEIQDEMIYRMTELHKVLRESIKELRDY